MRLYSTKTKSHKVSLAEAVMRGLPPDNGLYMPERLPRLPRAFLDNLDRYSFPEIAYTVSRTLIDEELSDTDLRRIIDAAVTFPAPLVRLDDRRHVLELFHGPSLAFKDFGARFMAQLMGHFNRHNDEELTILVATSGDTGGAVAAGFYRTPGIRVVILYPSGKVSALQEKQLTTLGHNISALEIDGTFDDCQALVKRAFLDRELNDRKRLSSANSINIARLIPQSFYYFEGYKQLGDKGTPAAFCIPSGNFGNLTAGLIARRMGLPIEHLIAATNANDVVPVYLASGQYKPRPSVRTLSNAMDVGAPSNFARLMDMFGSTWNQVKSIIHGYAYADQRTESAMREVAERYDYTIDPHGAVGYLALEDYLRSYPSHQGVILETAHPAKFLTDVERVLNKSIKVPPRLASLADKKKVSTPLPVDYQQFRGYLLSNG